MKRTALAVAAALVIGALGACAEAEPVKNDPNHLAAVKAAQQMALPLSSSGDDVSAFQFQSDTSAAVWVNVSGHIAQIAARRIDGRWRFGCVDLTGQLVPFDEESADATQLRQYFQGYGWCPSPFKRGDKFPPPPNVAATPQ